MLGLLNLDPETPTRAMSGDGFAEPHLVTFFANAGGSSGYDMFADSSKRCMLASQGIFWPLCLPCPWWTIIPSLYVRTSLPHPLSTRCMRHLVMLFANGDAHPIVTGLPLGPPQSMKPCLYG